MTVVSTSTYGFHATDITVRTAILAAFDDLRANPYLLDLCLGWLMTDQLTSRYYGEKELLSLKEWFLNNEVVVTTGYSPDTAKLAHVTIWLAEQSERQKNIGDTNDTPRELLSFKNNIPTAQVFAFTPQSFDPTTGTIVLPPGLTTSQIHPDMRVFDRVNSAHYTITDVLSDTSFKIEVPFGVSPNLTNAIVVNATDLKTVSWEGITLNETVRIVVSVAGEAVKAIALHHIVMFCLHKYKQQYLEARGFELPVISSSAIGPPMQGSGQSQWVYQRTINVQGIVRYYWPKNISNQVQGVSAGFLFDSPAPVNQAEQLETQGWSTDPWE